MAGRFVAFPPGRPTSCAIAADAVDATRDLATSPMRSAQIIRGARSGSRSRVAGPTLTDHFYAPYVEALRHPCRPTRRAGEPHRCKLSARSCAARRAADGGIFYYPPWLRPGLRGHRRRGPGRRRHPHRHRSLGHSGDRHGRRDRHHRRHDPQRPRLLVDLPLHSRIEVHHLRSSRGTALETAAPRLPRPAQPWTPARTTSPRQCALEPPPSPRTTATTRKTARCHRAVRRVPCSVGDDTWSVILALAGAVRGARATTSHPNRSTSSCARCRIPSTESATKPRSRPSTSGHPHPASSLRSPRPVRARQHAPRSPWPGPRPAPSAPTASWTNARATARFATHVVED